MPQPSRLATMLEASLVADSLALPAHWIYEPAAIARAFGRVEELLAPPATSYHAGRSAGAQTHYGDQALTLMDSLTPGEGFDADAFDARWRAMWTDYPGYRDGATRTTLANLEAGIPAQEAGSPSSDLGGASRIAPLLVAMADSPDEAVVEAARAQTALTHRDVAASDAAAFLVRATRAVLDGASVPDALQAAAQAEYHLLSVASHLEAARAALQAGSTEAVQALGPACGVEGAFPAMLALALAHPGDLEGALIANVMAGGDSAARGLGLGMILGAAPGAVVPARWQKAWLARPRVEAFLRAQARR
ncbi:MAG TPA: ADP-ribosylglycohydrolase family protein [Pantanalinema sp.]